MAGLSEKPKSVLTEHSSFMANRMNDELLEKNVQVAIISRQGQPKSNLPDDVNYTHVAFAVLEKDENNNPRYAVYNLYQDKKNKDTSYLFKSDLMDFYNGVKGFSTGIIIPSAQTQEKLMKTIHSSVYDALHDPNYSSVANPFNTGFQNCTEFTLDVSTAGIFNVDDEQKPNQTNSEYKKEIQDKVKNLEIKHYQPYNVKANILKVLLADVVKKDFSLKDQKINQIYTTTFETIGEFYKSNNPGSKVIENAFGEYEVINKMDKSPKSKEAIEAFKKTISTTFLPQPKLAYN